VPFADIVGWHKTMIEYEVARAHPSLEHAAEASAGLREAVGRGRMIGDQSYVDACRALDAARERFRAATAEFQALIFPTAPDAAPAGMKTGDPRFIVPFTALGGPIVSIPVGIGAHGLPLGLMLIGAPGRDAAIADMAGEIARAIERPR
jgi:aspartyl-tRNA(Asn)/glutamyl-tRNA(Gln) amidotransferase subunit A